MKLKDLSLFVKLLTPVVILFAVIGGVLFIGKMNNDRLIAGQREIAHNGITSLVQVSEIVEEFQTIDGRFYRYLIGQSTGNLEGGEKKMAALKEEAIALDAKLGAFLATVEKGAEKDRLLKLQNDFKTTVIGMNDDGVYDVAIQMMGIDVGFVLKGIGSYTNVYNEFIDALGEFQESVRVKVNALVEESEQEITRFQLLSIVATAAVGILALLIAVFFIIIVVRSVKDIAGVTALLAEGRTDVDIEARERKDELGTIVESLKKFKENQMQVLELKDQQERLKAEQEAQRKQDMFALAESFDSQIGGLISSLTTASGSLQTTAESMRSIAEETVGASNTVASSSEQAQANVNTVASAMEEMSAASNEITVQASSARRKSNDTASEATRARETVGNLSHLVENIGEVVTAIQDIAEQTNLLALNATIEAARAGEAGKGFAVVADEVKKLASETSKKTEEIGSRIADIQGATQLSVDAMESIITNISDIDQAITGVSAAIEEQNATNKEVARSVSEASHGVQQVSMIISDVKTRAGDTGESADTVLDAARDVAKLSDNLRGSVGEFLQRIRSDS